MKIVRILTSMMVIQRLYNEPQDTLAIVEKLDLSGTRVPKYCVLVGNDPNYIVDDPTEQLLKAGHLVVCAGGNKDLPVIDISPSCSRWCN